MNAVDGWLVHVLNTWIGGSSDTFSTAIALTNRVPWLLACAILTTLWFAGEAGAIPTKIGRLTRLESRRRVVTLVVALLVSLALAHLLQITIVRLRPFAEVALNVPLNPDQWDSFRGSLLMQGSFPSTVAIVSSIVVTGLFAFNRTAGIIVMAGYVCVNLLQIGLGLYWPSDVLAGALLGILVSSVALAVVPLLRGRLDPGLLQFERHPAAMYLLGFVLLFDLSQKFSGLSELLRLGNVLLGR